MVNLASMAGLAPGPFTATYSATKAFVVSFTESIAEELRGTGVRAMALCPGFTRTEFQERAGIDARRVPSVAWMSAEAVVDSALAALARGEVIHVPGGLNRMMRNGMHLVPRWIAARVVAQASRRFTP